MSIRAEFLNVEFFTECLKCSHEAFLLHDDRIPHGLTLVDVDHADDLFGVIVHGSIRTILRTESRTVHASISLENKLE